MTIQPQLLRMTMTFVAINLTPQIGPIEFVSENAKLGQLVCCMSESFEGHKEKLYMPIPAKYVTYVTQFIIGKEPPGGYL